jgi:hypothetical protein
MPAVQHDWFENLTGFQEEGYERTRSRFAVDGEELVSKINGERYGIGELSLPTLAELRGRVEVPTSLKATQLIRR